MSFTNLGTTFGYTDENLERADQGDPRALREAALSMLEGSAHPDALTGVVPWYVGLLRWGGTGTVSSCRDVLGALKIDVKAGRLDQGGADAVRAFVGELQFSSPLDTAIVQAAVGAFEQTSVELEAIYLMWLKDTVETGGSVALSDVEAALAVAEELTDAMGPTGIAGWFRTVLVRNSLATGEIDQAARLAQEAVDEFAALQGPRQEYTTRLADAVRLAMAVAQVQGDSSHVTELEQEFASVLAEADTDEQRLRDDHGHLADFASDFRPTAGE